MMQPSRICPYAINSSFRRDLFLSLFFHVIHFLLYSSEKEGSRPARQALAEAPGISCIMRGHAPGHPLPWVAWSCLLLPGTQGKGQRRIHLSHYLCGYLPQIFAQAHFLQGPYLLQ